MLNQLIRIVTALVLMTPPALAEVDLTLSMEGTAGHESNRYREPDAESSSFFEAAPALGIVWFASDTTEFNADASYRRREFMENDFSFTETIAGQISLHRFWDRVDGALALGVGMYKDDAIPTDDQTWISASPLLRYTATDARQYTLQGVYSSGNFDSRETTTGKKQDGTRWELRPGITWPLSIRSSLWTEGYAESYASNEESEEYSGLGMAVGAVFSPTPKLQVRIAASWGVREYPNDYLDIVVDREDEPAYVDGYASFRLLPWADLFMSGRWATYGSTEPSLDYDDWSVRIGIRLAQDIPLT